MDWDIPESIIEVSNACEDNVFIFNGDQLFLVKNDSTVIIDYLNEGYE